MARRIASEDLRRAAVYFLCLADSYEKQDPHGAHDQDDATIEAVVGAIEKHDRAEVEKYRRRVLVGLVPALADLYRAFQANPTGTAHDLQQAVVALLTQHGVFPEDIEKAFDLLVPTVDEIVEQGGPIETARAAVGEMFGASPRSLVNWWHQHRLAPNTGSPVFPSHAQGLGFLLRAIGLGDADVARITLEAFSTGPSAGGRPPSSAG